MAEKTRVVTDDERSLLVASLSYRECVLQRRLHKEENAIIRRAISDDIDRSVALRNFIANHALEF